MLETSDDPTTAALLTKFAIEPAPESVARLATLVSGRGAQLKSIARVIASDKALTFRLLDGDVPRQGLLGEVEAQVFRYGVEGVIVLAMAEPLLAAVRRTFETMAGYVPEVVNPKGVVTKDATGLMSNLSFTGRANGQVFLRGHERLWDAVAAKILGQREGTVVPKDMVDVFAELSNMIVGNFKSNLSDAGLPCKLSVPRVSADTFYPPKVTKGRHRNFAFNCQKNPLLVDIAVEFAH